MNKYKTEVSKHELEAFPLSKYEGTIELIEDEERAEQAVQLILRERVVGIDTETKPSFKKGLVHQVSLIQIATPTSVYLFRINKTGITNGLITILESSEILKVGIAINDDLKDLQRLRKFTPRKFVDLNTTATDLGYESIGAKKLSALILGFRISKKQQTSNWEREELSEQQINYAATDAWICLAIYSKMTEMYPELANVIRKRL